MLLQITSTYAVARELSHDVLGSWVSESFIVEGRRSVLGCGCVLQWCYTGSWLNVNIAPELDKRERADSQQCVADLQRDTTNL